MKRETLDLVIFVAALDGGVGKVITQLINGVKKHGYSIEVWTLQEGEYTDEIRRYKVPIKLLPQQRVHQVFWDVRKLLIEYKPRAILSVTFHANAVIALAKLLSSVKTKVIVSEHIALRTELKQFNVLKRFFLKCVIFFAYRLVNGIVSVSQDAANDISKIALLPKKTITTIYNPVISKELFIQAEQSIDHKFFALGEPVIIGVGRLAPQKDFETLLRAFALVVKKRKVRLIILGEGRLREELQQLIHDLGISEYVSLNGYVKNPYPYFVKSDLFVLSSRWEGLPTVLIEALALCPRIVSTDCPSGPREILENGKHGILVPVGDHDKLSKAILNSLGRERKNISIKDLLQYTEEVASKKYIQLLFDN